VAAVSLTTSVGRTALRSPLIAASGTVGSVWEWAQVADVRCYGAAVAKSTAPEKRDGRPAPRMATTSVGMLNGVGLQGPGVEAWAAKMAPLIPKLGVPVWGSAVGADAEAFAQAAAGLAAAGASAVEVNLSCPNEDGLMWSMDPERSASVVAAAAAAVDVPVGAKLSPNTADIVAAAAACADAGADFVVLTNTALGFGASVERRKPLLSGGVGGYSGPGLKPLSLRCVYEVHKAMPDLPIVGCGGVVAGRDVVEYLMTGASAVEMGTVHLAEPKAGARVKRELVEVLERLGAAGVDEIVGSVSEW